MTENAQQEMERPTVRVNITLPPDVDEMLERRAKAERRSKSAHVAWLIEQDARSAELPPAVLPS